MDAKLDPYQPPAWACKPSLTSCCLHVVKSGKRIDKVREVSEEICTIFGRNVKHCDVVLTHPSISRQHATIVHGSSGNMYLIDLGSSHGTFVNQKRLEVKKRQALAEGDKIRFGASTRTYVVQLRDTDWDHGGGKDKEDSSRKRRSRGDDRDDDRRSHRSSDRDRRDRENRSDRNGHRDDRPSKRRRGDITRYGDRDSGAASNGDRVEPKTVRVRHILVKHIESRRPKSWKDMAVTRSKEEAIEKIKQFRRQIDSGKVKFRDIAKEESDCNSHNVGGDLGAFGRGRMQKPFEDAAFALKVDELSEPVITNSGVHLILRTE